MMQLSLLLLLATVLLCPAHSAAVFKFDTARSELVRDEADGGRIRGIQSRDNKTFVLGGLFSVHSDSLDSDGSPCGPIRQDRGLERVEAMLYAIDVINADPALLPGVELGYDIRDTCNSETVGLDEAIDLIITGSDLGIQSCEADSIETAPVPTSGIVGAAGSRVSVPVAALGRLFRMPQVSYASTSPLLSDRSRYGFFRRTIPSDDLQVLAMVDILLRFGWNYVSILHSEDTYGSAGINEFVNVSASHEICIDLRRGIPPTFNDADYDNLVADLGTSRANVVIFFANQEPVEQVMTRVYANETLRTRFTWIGSDGWAGSLELAHEFNETAVGMFGVAPSAEHLGDFQEYLSQLTVDSNVRNDWFSEYYAAFANCTLHTDCDNDTNITSFSNYQQESFIPLVVDAVYAFAYALHNFLVENCNETDSAPFIWFKENGTCLGQSRELNGSSLLEYLNDVNFTSITNVVIRFEASGSVEGFYDILNYQATLSEAGEITDFEFVNVGTWDGSNEGDQLMLMGNENLQFGLLSDKTLRTAPLKSGCGVCDPGFHEKVIPGSCCSICEPCVGRNYSSEPLVRECSSCLDQGGREKWGNNPLTGSNSCVLIPETFASYGDLWAIPSLILACVGLISVVATAVVFGIFWKTPIVKSSSREQMILLLIGIACSFCLSFFYVAPPSIPVCLINRLGIWFCYSLMFGALTIKAQRVTRIFYGIKRDLHYTPRFASPFFQVSFTLIIVAVQMALIVISLVLFHPDVQRTIRFDQNSDGRLGLPEVVITCRQENTAVIILSLLYETAIITVATILGLFSFKFPENFNEAKYISFCTFSLLVVWIGLIPTYFTTQDRQEIQNAVISLFIIMSAFGVLCFIFGPKLFIMIFKPERNSSHFSTHHPNTEDGSDSEKKVYRANKRDGMYICTPTLNPFPHQGYLLISRNCV